MTRMDAVDWLLTSDEPGIRMQVRRDLLDDPPGGDADEILAGPKVSGLLEGQQANGGFVATPGAPAVPEPAYRRGDRAGVAGAAVSAVLALRHPVDR